MLLGDQIGIAAVSAWLPATSQTGTEAVELGLLAADELAESGVERVPVSDALSAPDMAVRAADDVLSRAGVPAAAVDLVAHAWTYHQGHDFWSPAHYVAAQVGAHEAFPLGIQQMSNGGAAALLTAATWLLARPGAAYALVTTGDRFTLPGFDRWSGDYAVAYGDGATAAVLHRRVPGGADELDLLSLKAVSASGLEEMYRGDDDFSPAPRWRSSYIDIRRPKKAYLAAGGMEVFREASRQKIREVLAGALHEAGLEPDDRRLRVVLLPRLGPRTLDLMYLPVVEDMVKAQPTVLGERTGHLGAGDFLANLADVRGLLDAGDLAVVLGGGGGFTWTCAVVRRP